MRDAQRASALMRYDMREHGDMICDERYCQRAIMLPAVVTLMLLRPPDAAGVARRGAQQARCDGASREYVVEQEAARYMRRADMLFISSLFATLSVLPNARRYVQCHRHATDKNGRTAV